MTTTDLSTLTPSAAWSSYVGNDDPRDYSDDDIAAYVSESDLCADLCAADRAYLTVLLCRYADSVR